MRSCPGNEYFTKYSSDAFSQVSDSSGVMEWDKFSDYLQQVLALATAVFEGPTFGYTETALEQCFQKVFNLHCFSVRLL